MKLSVFTTSTPTWSPAEVVHNLAAQGWDGVEWRIHDQTPREEPDFWQGNLSTWPLTGFESRIEEISALTRGAGLEFSAIPSYVWCFEHDKADRMLQLTKDLGATQVRFLTPNYDGSNARDQFAGIRRDFEWLSERAAAVGVKALIEIHFGSVIASATSAYRAVEGLDPRHVGVIHDVGNIVIEGYEDYLASFQMLGEYLAHVHVKNALWSAVGTDGDGAAVWKHRPATLKEGQADLRSYFEALRKVGYDGWVTVEDYSTAVPLEERTAGNLAYVRGLIEQVGQMDESELFRRPGLGFNGLPYAI